MTLRPGDPGAWGLEQAPRAEKKPAKATAKTAAAVFSPAEQAEIINEGENVRASNLASLDLTGTHYAPLALEPEDDDIFLW